MLPYYFLVCVFMTFQKGRRRKSTRFGIWSTWLMFGDLSQKKSDKNSFLRGMFFMWSWRSNMLNMDAICRGCVLSFSVTIRIPRAVPPSQLGLSCHLGGLQPYPAHLLQPNKNIWHQPASQGILTIPDTDTEKSFELRKEEGWPIKNSHHHPHHCVLMTPLLNNPGGPKCVC